MGEDPRRCTEPIQAVWCFLVASSLPMGRVQVAAGALRLTGHADAEAPAANLVSNSGFENMTSITADGAEGQDISWGYNSVLPNWMFSSLSGVASCPGSRFASGYKTADGVLAAFVQSDGFAETSFTVPRTGWYRIDFIAFKRNQDASPCGVFDVLLDDAPVCRFQVNSLEPRTFGTAFPNELAAGTHTLRFQGVKMANLDTMALLDDVRVTEDRARVGANIVVNGGFEMHDPLLESTPDHVYQPFQYAPTGATWVFVDPDNTSVVNAGIAQMENAWAAWLPAGSMSGLYPGNQLLPTYMMWYVLQCAEHVQRAGSDAGRFKAAVRERVLQNVAYLRQYENEDGLLENLPGWVFVEWSKANDFTAGVNYPANALWSATLETAGRLYACRELVEKSEVVRETIRRQAFDGTYFRDHALRDASGTLKARSDKTETCQYYQFSFGVASREAYPSLWERLTTEFGPGKTADGLHPSNMFLGQLLRLDLLGRFGRPSQELAEIKHYFGTMAKTSGALWEFADGHDSRCHGFGSYVAVLILRDILGVKEIDAQSRCVSISPGESPLVSAAAAVRTSEGTLGVRLLRESGRSVRNVELPSGWTAK